eukprot:TRINITY_DN15625_c0_g1_i8.p1 TRINITY_DN15625_c0_g1~~TRINITY_DN15625_c0_g1_i8.p1  ORF type:complete len:456 (+),score=80.78 TRINITY_DN15625_c0_g1_i8:50-1417(+)
MISCRDALLGKLVRKVCEAPPPTCDANYELKWSKDKGVYVVASRDLPKGAEVLRDTPCLSACRQDFLGRCLRCSQSLVAQQPQQTSYASRPLYVARCSSCGHGWCGTDCRSADEAAHSVECGMLRHLADAVAACAKFKDVQGHMVGTMLRGFAAKAGDPLRWLAIAGMEAHMALAEETDDRFAGWRAAAQAVYDCLVSKGVLRAEAAAPEDALRALLVASVNALVDGGTHGETKRHNALAAVYPLFCRMDHSCVPNICFHTTTSGPLTVVARTRASVKKGESLAFSYALLDEPTHRRQAQLLRDKYFRCRCERCNGRGTTSELPGELCSLLCGGSCSGVIKPKGTNYDIARTPWECSACKKAMSFDDVEALEAQLIAAVDSAKTVDHCKGFLAKFGEKLPKLHYLRFQVQCLTVALMLRPHEDLIQAGRAGDIPKALVKELITVCYLSSCAKLVP